MATAAALKTSLCRFASDLYDKVLAEQGKNLENVFLSPASIYTACIMTLAGASGDTRTELINALHVPKEMATGNLHQMIGPSLMNYFHPSEGVELSMANRLFLLHDVKLVDEFRQTLQKFYKADAELLGEKKDLESKRVQMNHWVAEHTKQKIKDLIPQGGLPESTVLAVMNALYFRGFWQDAFEKVNTHPEDFHCLNGSKIKVPMMYKEERYPFVELEDEDALALKIPFKDTNWEMLIVLPNEVNGLQKLVTEFRKEGKLAAILSSDFEETKVELHLPRFKLDAGKPLDLKAALAACGMKTLFNRSADLTKMCESPRLFIESAYHKAVLEVDESGATAAAATGMIAVPMCLVHNPEFRVNKPFFVALVMDRTVPVFVGHVVKPEGI